MVIIANCRAFSALSDLKIMCETAGLQPTAVAPVKSKDTDAPPLGLHSVLMENGGAVERMKNSNTPIAFNNQPEGAPPPEPLQIGERSRATIVGRQTSFGGASINTNMMGGGGGTMSMRRTSLADGVTTPQSAGAGGWETSRASRRGSEKPPLSAHSIRDRRHRQSMFEKSSHPSTPKF